MDAPQSELLQHLRELAELEPEVILDPLTIIAPAPEPFKSLPPAPRPPAPIVEAAAANPELLELDRQSSVCTLCTLHETRNKVVFGVGSHTARLMFVGEGPGADEDRQGEPFVGRAGQLLNKILVAMKMSRSEVYIANIVKCRPPENRTPLPNEAGACMPYLRRQIALIKPSLIVALGAVAAMHLLGLPSAGTIKSLRGRIFNLDGIPLIVTYHPAALLRTDAYKKPTWEDMQKAMKLLSGELKWNPEEKPFAMES